MNYKFSIITPAHKKNPYLEELYDSILAQTYSNWEWVLWLNNHLKEHNISERIRNDDRVKIFRTENTSKNIGYHKHHAFHKGTGDVLVEVDYDDMITSNCLEELNKAYQDENIGFAYSNAIQYNMKKEFIPYNPAHGWSYSKVKFREEERYVMNSWHPSSHSLSFIWYAPDHVRSWRSDLYKKVGGHNQELEICDDHELMIRTYLNTNMYFIEKPLYVYRVTGNNTYLKKNSQIQKETVRLAYENVYALAEHDAEKNNLLKVDLGGGLYPREGYMTIDQHDADIICDLNDGIPLPDNSVGVLNASHVIEHLRDPIKTMREIHRVLAHGGWALIEVPSTDGRGAWQDPTHVSFWNEHSFWYYTDKSKAEFIRNKDIRFQSYRLDTWEMSPHIPVVTTNLVAIKEGGKRLPGILNI
jgi:glycosyltransferase involved in cell wall biosynthesis